jgi:hypothetical protein
MKQVVVMLSVLFAVVGFADHTPMTSLPEGQYLGSGGYTTSFGDKGHFATYADIGSDYWNISHYMDGEIRSYSAFFNFDENGFFDVEMLHQNENGEEDSWYGRGYCQSVQCHYSLLVGDKIVEETVSFVTWEDRVYWVGSVTPHGDDSNGFSVSWESSTARID